MKKLVELLKRFFKCKKSNIEPTPVPVVSPTPTLVPPSSFLSLFTYYSSEQEHETVEEACSDTGDDGPLYIDDSEPSNGRRVYKNLSKSITYIGNPDYYISIKSKESNYRYVIAVDWLGNIVSTHECS